MLSQLTVKNFTLVDQLELEFDKGMTVITGETGAGKSIMLNALGLALGDRSETGLIGLNADKAEIHATFELTGNLEAQQWLQQRELAGDQAECILRRVIGKDGRSRGFINGAPSTINDMKNLGEMLIDIHSQHEHQSLLRKETHPRLLDEFGGSVENANQVSDLFHQYQTSVEKLHRLINNNEAQSARQQLLSYQAEELGQLNIVPDEQDSLEEEQKRLANTESILTNCNAVIDLCRQDAESSALDQLSKSVQLLQAVNLAELAPITEMLASAKIQLDEAIHDLQRFCGDFEMDPVRLTEVEDRLSTIYDLCRKHRIEPAGIPQLVQAINAELESLGNIDDEIRTTETETKELKTVYAKAADKLSATRTRAAKKLSKKVSQQLNNLGMSGSTFAIALTAHDADIPLARGLEEVEFLISTNPGQAPRSLNKIASGGELSRISLAIQVVAADTSRVPTLIFDEVDVGIGGGVAEVVGSSLRKLGQEAQIVCVTHLPQVAAQGHQHLKVTKKSPDNQAHTEIERLDEYDKIREIARMLGGLEMTDQSLAHAQEMYTTAQTAVIRTPRKARTY